MGLRKMWHSVRRLSERPHNLIAISDIPALSAIGRVVALGCLLALLLAAAFAPRRRAGGGRVTEFSTSP